MQCQSKSQQLFYEYKQTDSKVYMERQKIQNSQYNIEEEKQSWKTDTDIKT